jgi:predicted dienelactone hydrolase
MMAMLLSSSVVAGAQTPGLFDAAVGSTTRRFVPEGDYQWRGARTRALVTTLWYPASSGSPMTDHMIGPPEAPLFVGGRWSDDARIAAGTHPLVLLSHGTGGTPEGLVWLARGLAAHGFIVAGVAHPGNNALEPYTDDGFLLWWERARDLSTVLDFLLEDAEFGAAIDRTRVGAAGFSLGGYAAFVLAGARTVPQRLLDFCDGEGAEGCGDPPEFPGLFARWRERRVSDPAFQALEREAGVSAADPRIRAVFAIAPAIAQAFDPESLHGIAVPTVMVVGSADTVAPPRSNAQYLARQVRGAEVTVVRDAGHYTFLAACTPEGRDAMPHLCTDRPGVDRPRVHQQALDLAVRFFTRELRRM